MVDAEPAGSAPVEVIPTQAKARRRKPLPLKELAGFRASMPGLRRPAAELLRAVRDEGL